MTNSQEKTPVMDAEDAALLREWSAQLPDDLKMLSLEFGVYHRYAPLSRSVYLGWTEGQSERLWCEALDDVFSNIGRSDTFYSDETSVFGTSKNVRVRVDVIGTPETLRELQREANEKTFKKGLTFRSPGGDTRAVLEHVDETAVAAGSMTETHSWPHFKDASPEEFCTDAEATRFQKWARAAAATPKDIDRFLGLMNACNWNAIGLTAALARLERKPTPQTFLVPGLIPRGSVTLLAGNRKVGKSAMALELAVTVARRQGSWMGFPVSQSGAGFAVYLYGEDSAGVVSDRVALMSGCDEPPYLLDTIYGNGNEGSLQEILSTLSAVNVELLVVDPARKFYCGDEDGSDPVNGFFSKVEAFAREKDCGAVVLHHLRKGATPHTLEDVATNVRGSGVWLDRPRVILAALRKGAETHFGIADTAGVPLHNFPQSDMVAGVQRLRRNEATFCHVPCGTERTTAVAKTTTVSDAGPVLAAASRILASGQKLSRTGAAGLFEQTPPELAGMSRRLVRASVDALVGQGEMHITTKGVLSLPARSPSDVDLVG